jgi:tRNA dimethylallyltransferase
MQSVQDIVVIVAGPTASGKSALALALAEAYGGTVINADALQAYRDLRILAARPDAAAEARAPHRLYGYLDAAERGTAARWRDLALVEIAAAVAAGRLPIVTGGTGLYLRALTAGLAAVPDIPPAVRMEAATLYRDLGGAGFRERLATVDPVSAARFPPGDRTRLTRAYEVARATGVSIAEWQRKTVPPAPYRFVSLLLMPPRDALYAACDARFAAMVAAGGLDEARALLERGLDPGLPAMKAVGVPELMRHLRGELALGDAVAAAQQATRRYAKRQLTWFRHQFEAGLTCDAQYSESFLHCSRHFIDRFLLTGWP